MYDLVWVARIQIICCCNWLRLRVSKLIFAVENDHFQLESLNLTVWDKVALCAQVYSDALRQPKKAVVSAAHNVSLS